jgi:hypothetical protein
VLVKRLLRVFDACFTVDVFTARFAAVIWGKDVAAAASA